MQYVHCGATHPVGPESGGTFNEQKGTIHTGVSFLFSSERGYLMR